MDFHGAGRKDPHPVLWRRSHLLGGVGRPDPLHHQGPGAVHREEGLSGAGAVAGALLHGGGGYEPGLRFEVTRGGGILPSYPVDNRADFGAPPPPKNGQHYVKVSYPSQPVGGGMDTYSGVNKPYLDFFKDVIAKYPTGGPRGGLFMGDH